MALGRGLGQLLTELEESYEKDLNMYLDRDGAHDLVLDILEVHGSAFILDILEKNGAGNIKKSHAIKGLYDKLTTKYPSIKKAKIREMVASRFKISDKAVQKHIYKGRKK